MLLGGGWLNILKFQIYCVLCVVRFLNSIPKGEPNLQCWLQTFEKMKPFYVQRLKERNPCACACKYHVEMVELILRFNNMHNSSIKGVHGTQCMCACDICSINIVNVLGECIANKCQFSGVTNMWNSILCPFDDSPWHNLSCLKVTCVQCGIDMLMTCPIEEDATCSQLMM